MILVADASALIALSACDSLPLLEALFGTVLVQEAVFLEVAAVNKPQSDRLRSYLQGKVRMVDMQPNLSSTVTTSSARSMPITSSFKRAISRRAWLSTSRTHSLR
jgi:predicted nucleic acid-binding protein